jgi:FAD/FMN-containing dehydrogenase
MNSFADYEARKNRLSAEMRQSGGVRLKKNSSNLFRAREKNKQRELSVRDFNHVLAVNAEEGWAEVEGMTTYEEFANETLKYNLMPAVVPQLKTITIGGAVAGVGIEATSFRYGFVHETVLEMEILLASGETVICNKDEHADLFYSFPNSYGTFGYALRLKVKLIPVKPFVKIQHARFADAESYFQALEKTCGSADVDFVDGAMFGPTELYLTTGTFVDEAPFVSDYTYLNIYYKSLRERKEDYLSVYDFLWRWDTDWFWCSASFGAQNLLIRRIFGKKRLNSAVYWKIKNFVERHPFIQQVATGFSRRESVIQDVDIPVENAPKFAGRCGFARSAPTKKM